MFKKTKRIKYDPRHSLNNPDRFVDLILSFPVDRRDDVSVNIRPPRGEKSSSRVQRYDIIQKLHGVGLELTESLATDGSNYIFRVSAPTEMLEQVAEQMGPVFTSKLRNSQDDTQKGLWPGFAPFCRENKDKYEMYTLGYFKPVERQTLIRYIIERALGGDGTTSYEIDKLLGKGVMDLYPTHSAIEQGDLIDMWASFGLKMLTTRQPIEKIRDYFGEEIALYFAFLGHYTQWLVIAAVFGLIVEFMMAEDGKANGDSEWAYINGAFIVIWASLFLRYWEREENSLQVKWDTQDHEDEEMDRYEFQGTFEISPMTLDLELVFSDSERNWRYAWTWSCMAICIGVVLMNSICVILVKQKLMDAFGPIGGSAGGIFNAVTVAILNMIYKGIAYRMNEYENHQTKTQYNDKLIVKLFLFEFSNNFATILFFAYMATRVELLGTEIECQGSCLEEVKSLTQSLVLVNLAIGNVVETLLPYMQFKAAQKMRQEAAQDVYHSQHEIQACMPQYEGTFEDYNEIVIQFATVTVFALAYPLGALLALFNNMIEIRSDAFKLVQVTQRPFAKKGQDIGSWFGILKIIVAIATLNNCALAGFTSREFYNRGWVDNDAGGAVKKLAILFLVEHVLFFACYMMEFAIAAQPADLYSAKARLDMKKFDAITTQDARDRNQHVEKHNRELFGLIDESDVLPLEDQMPRQWRGQPQYGHTHLKNESPPRDTHSEQQSHNHAYYNDPKSHGSCKTGTTLQQREKEDKYYSNLSHQDEKASVRSVLCGR